MAGFLSRLLRRGERPIDYEQAKAMAADPDPQVRGALARRTDLKPEILYFLAEDSDAAVRRAVAANPHAPPQANLLLAGDSSEQVRGDLAGKIARLAPGLTAGEQDRLRRLTYEAVETLARDQITRVREILADALKDVADAPAEVIGHLARDSALSVAGPVLRYSPVLTDDDLLDIIAAAPIAGALAAISRRAEVNVRVCDAIAATDDVDAVAALLGNPSAQIREETLDRLVDRASDIEAWHRPLVERPRLGPRAAQRLARFVASDLLKALAARVDLAPETAAAVAAAVEKRIAEMDAPTAPPTDDRPRPADLADAVARARAMAAAGTLTPAEIEQALDRHDPLFAVAALAQLAGIPAQGVSKVYDTQSAKGLMAVCWRAGLDAGFACRLQSRLLRLPPGKVLSPGLGGAYPLSDSEMEWQLEFFGAHPA